MRRKGEPHALRWCALHHVWELAPLSDAGTEALPDDVEYLCPEAARALLDHLRQGGEVRAGEGVQLELILG